MEADIIECALTGRLGELADDVLEDGICGAASRIAAATCAFLLAVAEFDRRKVWENHECLSMSHWLTWRCGLSPVTAREHVRVANRITELGQVREEFAAGRLSYSQVRAISRVANARSEGSFVELARVMTAGQLEGVLRTFRRVKASITSDEASGDKRRALEYHYDDEGCMVGSFCLPAEDGALFAALVEAQVREGEVSDADRTGIRDPIASVRADALLALVAAGADNGADDPGHRDDNYLVTVVVEKSALVADQPVDGATCYITGGHGLGVETAQRLLCDSSYVELTEDTDGNVIDLGRKTRKPNRALRRALAHRDGHCRFPGCDRKRTQAHHIQHWTKGGPTSLANLVSICWRHHRLLHEHHFEIRPMPNGELQFVRPNGQIFSERPRPADLPADQPLAATVHIDPDACDNEWLGDRITRLDWMIEDLLFADGTLDQKKEYSMATKSDHADPAPYEAHSDQWWKTGTGGPVHWAGTDDY